MPDTAGIKLCSFRHIYRDWYIKQFPNTPAPKTSADFPREGEYRKHFEYFLDKLGIEPNLLKKKNHFAFNKDGETLLLDFLDNYTAPIYKDIRRGRFSANNIHKYEDILSLTLSNMQALDLPLKTLDTQAMVFWNTIIEGQEHPEEFLSGCLLVYSADELRSLLSPDSPLKFLEDLFFINARINEDFMTFKKKWQKRIDFILDFRKAERDRFLSLDESHQQVLDTFIEKLLALPEPGDSNQNDFHLPKHSQISKTERAYEDSLRDIFGAESILETLEEICEPLSSDSKSLDVRSSREIYTSTLQAEGNDALGKI